ncbi:inorganic phosphate transporter [Halococcus saccharolyticus]|uniref:Phosphate transporter n=1 Tax=Halococcus saccharolyticus DSM 5350 TaxID=1227455 RepID=M0MIK3_9EURY|nr:inorganic phosphate transporter [Halococcus saccharolyticus]EMA44285.1 phosphate transporter [Halococcus saccharolyticus DSM 5350]
MALSPLLLLGLGVVVFVGFNIGGSNVGVAFGPAVGSKSVSATGAAALMTVSFFVGGWTVGRGVVRTMGGRIVPSSEFTLVASIVVLFFIGLALFLANVVGVPASTSMTGVGSIAGLGLATNTLNWTTMGEIVSWWIVSPVIAFWVSGVIGRYFYPHLNRLFAVKQTEGSLFDLDRSRTLPRPTLGTNTTVRELVGTLLVVVVACYTAFSAGTSNAANAIAPLVGAGALDIGPGIILAGLAVGLGAFTIGRRTMDTMGNDLTEMPLLAALIVAVVSSTLVTMLSWFDIPVSVVIISTMSIVGLGWGRATRTVTVTDIRQGESPAVSVDALATDADGQTVGGGGTPPDPEAEPTPIGDETIDDESTVDLFKPGASARVIAMQNLVPAVATLTSFLLFRFVLLS